jgi:hypothetical protein
MLLCPTMCSDRVKRSCCYGVHDDNTVTAYNCACGPQLLLLRSCALLVGTVVLSAAFLQQ